MDKEFTKYEIARILGARALQISMQAPLLLKISEEELISMNFDPLKIAEKEFYSNVLPITVKRPLPLKDEDVDLEKLRLELEEAPDELKIKEESEIEKEMIESGELTELIEPEEEIEESVVEEEDYYE